MMRSLVLTASLGLVSLVACSDEVTTIPSGSGGSGAGTVTTSTTTSSGGSDACSIYDDDDASLGSLTIRFRNDTPQTIYLPSLCGAVPLMQFGPEGGGADNHAYIYSGSCLQTCEDLQTESPIACGACQETVIQLPPGSTWDFTWGGFLLQSAGMEAACWFDGVGGGSCAQELAADAGPYRATAEGYAECSQGGDPCACEGDQCFGSPSGPQAFSDLAEATFPEEGVMEVVFGVCAFGCPEG